MATRRRPEMDGSSNTRDAEEEDAKNTDTDSGTDTENDNDDGPKRIPGGKIRYDKYTHRWYDSYVLCFVSSWFFIPAVQALTCVREGNFALILVVINILSAVLSINYWRNATDGMRRKLDLSIAKLSFIVYFIFGMFNVENYLINFIGWPVFILMLASYKLSSHYWKFTKKRWLTYHVLFHILVVFEQCLIISGSYAENKPSAESIWNFVPFFNLNFLFEWMIRFFSI